ncbi:MAG: hypothetical protein H6Q69_2299 [Firmicutes bacterium]|nr:hypothetical protein [Bacillota bacterium]
MSNSFYVSTTGSDSNAGTLAAPFATLAKAQEEASTGDTVYIRGGTYSNFTIAASTDLYNYVHKFTKSGIAYRTYNSSETPIFDFSSITTDKRVTAFYIPSGVTDVYFLGITVTGVPVGSQKQSECFRIEGHAKFNQVVCCNNSAIGFYFTGKSATGSCTKCDAYNNTGVSGVSAGNIDGFGAHGNGVTFTKCRAWNNSDDGFDCISSYGSNTFDSCWSFSNRGAGDGNGFKIGGWGKDVITFEPPAHVVKNCIAAHNKAMGFYANHQPGKAATWTYNTAYNNSKENFNMLECATISDTTDISGTREVLHYNLAYLDNELTNADLPAANNTNNSWNLSSTMSSSDFQSLDISQLSEDRRSDGEMPTITFMQPTTSSDFSGLGYSN